MDSLNAWHTARFRISRRFTRKPVRRLPLRWERRTRRRGPELPRQTARAITVRGRHHLRRDGEPRQYGLAERSHPSDPVLENARSSVDNYIDTLQSAFIDPADNSPPPPDLDSLREEGLPTVSDAEFVTALEERETERRTLLGLIGSDVREWPSENGD